jgi:hypothetical protein
MCKDHVLAAQVKGLENVLLLSGLTTALNQID